MIEFIFYILWLCIFTLVGVMIITDYRAERMIGYPHLFIKFWLYVRFLMFMASPLIFELFFIIAPETASEFYLGGPDRVSQMACDMWGIEEDEM